MSDQQYRVSLELIFKQIPGSIRLFQRDDMERLGTDFLQPVRQRPMPLNLYIFNRIASDLRINFCVATNGHFPDSRAASQSHNPRQVDAAAKLWTRQDQFAIPSQLRRCFVADVVRLHGSVQYGFRVYNGQLFRKRGSNVNHNLKLTMSENKDEKHVLAADREENPYATPGDYERHESQKTDGRYTLAIVVLAILIVPATGIGGFTVFTGTLFASYWLGGDAIIWGVLLGAMMGAIVAIDVFTLFFRLILAIARNRHLPR